MRDRDLNPGPVGYEPTALPSCAIPQRDRGGSTQLLQELSWGLYPRSTSGQSAATCRQRRADLPELNVSHETPSCQTLMPHNAAKVTIKNAHVGVQVCLRDLSQEVARQVADPTAEAARVVGDARVDGRVTGCPPRRRYGLHKVTSGSLGANGDRRGSVGTGSPIQVKSSSRRCTSTETAPVNAAPTMNRTAPAPQTAPTTKTASIICLASSTTVPSFV